MAMETSTPKRNTSMRVDGNWTKETPLRVQRHSVLKEPNDKVWKSNDTTERDTRRVSMSVRKSIYSKPVEAGESPGLNDSIRALSEKDIKSQLFICSKLNAENKINANNAWKLKIIELLNQFVRKDNPDVLKVAGNSLEVAGKVYGIRVDDLHAESLKLASNLARTVDKKSQQDGEDNENLNETGDQPRQKQKKQKKRRQLLCEDKRQTVNHDPKAFKEPLPKLESAAFSAKVDNSVSATDNLFTNNMRTDNTGYRFIFLSEEKGFSWEPKSDKSIEPEVVTIETADLPSEFRICPPFKDFEVDVWDPNEDDIDIVRTGLSAVDIVFDDNGIPIPELDGSVRDVFQEMGDDGNDDEGFEEEVMPPLLLQENTSILNFQPSNQVLINSIERSEYSYNVVVGTCAGKIDQIWAGPSHWKIKHVRRTRLPVYTGQDGTAEQEKDKKKTSRKKSEPNMIDFTNLEEPLKIFKVLNRKKIPKDINESKITFPLFHSACSEIIEHINELIMVPSMKPVNKDKANIDCEIDEYRFDNPNDSNYVPNHLVDDDQPDLADDLFGDEPRSFDGEAGREAFMEENLIGVPELVTHSDMHYAIKAKKMDMKKLKSAVWFILTDKDNNESSEKVKDTSFSTMYKLLPDKLTENMKKELSCPLAFVALLHLCNEQNLHLQKGKGIEDFEILGPR